MKAVPKDTDSIPERSGGDFDQTQTLDSIKIIDDSKLTAARSKIESYLRGQNMHLSTFFSIIDSNNSKDLSRQEFVLAIGNSGLINMESNEINTLFDKLD